MMSSFSPRFLRSVSLGLAAFVGGTLLPLFAQEAPAARTEDPAEKQAREVLIRWMEAIGGAQEVNSLRTAFIKCTVDYGNGGPPMELLVRSSDGLYRMEYTTPAFGQLVQAFDGMVAWQYNETLGFGFLSPLEHQLNRVMTDFRAPVRVGSLYPYRKRLPDETVEGQTRQVVLMQAGDGREEKWYFDPATGYRVRMEMPGAKGPVVIDFSDFRRSIGALVREPFHSIRREDGRKIEVKIQLALYNEPMDAGLFNAPRGPTEDNRQIELLLNRNATLRGAQALSRIETRLTEQVVHVVTSGLRIPSRVYQKRPNWITMKQDVPGMGEVWQGYDGKVGWAWSEVEGYREMQGAELVQMISGADLEGALKLRALCPFRRFLDDRVVGDRRLVGVAMATYAGPEGNFYFDAKTYELVQVETFLQAGPSGRLKVTAEFADYRSVDGVQIPHRVRIINPAMEVDTTVLSVEHNVPLDDAIFAPRKE